MSVAQSIDVERLRRITKEVQERRTQESARAQARQEEEWDREAEEQAIPIAERVIKDIPALCEKAALEGRESATVMNRVRTRTDRKATEIVILYCKKNGLQAEVKHYTPFGSDDSEGAHDYLEVSWKNSGA